jgi:hypothetical protein
VASSTYVRFLRNQAAVSLPTPKRSAVSLTAAIAMQPAGRSPYIYIYIYIYVYI